MKELLDNKNSFDKIVLVSNDGDYIKMVKYLINKNLLEKIIFPNNKPSSLYKQINSKFKNCLENSKEKIQK